MLNEKLESMLNRMVGKVVNVGISGSLHAFKEFTNFDFWLNPTIHGLEYLELQNKNEWDMLSILVEDIMRIEICKDNKEVNLVLDNNLKISLWVG